MATNFPASLDTLINPSSNSSVANPSHAQQHADANDAIEALEAKVGITGSAVTTSHDYKIAQLESLVTSSVAGAKSIYQDVRNQSGSSLSKATPVYVSGSEGASGKILISAASNAAESTSSKTMGITTSAIANNSNGQVISEGILEGIDTTGAADGDPVWLGPNGTKIFGLVNKPSAPSHLVFLGVVIRGGQALTGSMYVKIQNGFELQELHNVQISSLLNGNILAYDSTSETWKNTNTLQSTSSTTPLVIKGSTSQSANIVEVQLAGSTQPYFSVTSGGNGIFYTALSVNQSNSSSVGANHGIGAFEVKGTSFMRPINAAGIVLITRGAASQTGNLQEWQNSSGTVLSSISSTGKLTSAVDASINGVAFGLGNSGSASRNIAIGLSAGESFGANDQNLAIGVAAGRYNYGANNVLIGYGAGIYNGGGGGSNNTYLGVLAGYSGVGSNNVMIGYQAGINTAGDNKLVISNSSTATPLIGGDFSAKTLTVAGNASIISQATGTVGLIVKAIASQTANLQEWQNSSGTVLTSIRSDGSIYSALPSAVSQPIIEISIPASHVYPGILTKSGTAWITALNPTGLDSYWQSRFAPNSTSTVPVLITGKASQTADLTQWKNSAGTVLASISPTGKLTSAVDAEINGYRIGKGAATTGTSNIAFGLNALNSNTTGSGNFAIGIGVLQANTTGANNFALGSNSLINSTTGDLNMALGNGVLYNNTTGYYNVGIGYNALVSNTTGRENMAIGISALGSLTTGALNTAVGQGAGYSTTTGNSNVFIGHAAGGAETGSNKLYIANSNTATPLIGGDFSAKTLTFAGNATITSQNASSSVLIVKAAASQSNSIIEWQNSSGTTIGEITGQGIFRNTYNYVQNLQGLGGGSGLYLNGVTTTAFNTNPAHLVFKVQGFASQTANLQEWQNSSGTVLANIASTGQINAGAGFYTDWAGVGSGRIGSAHLSVAAQYLGNIVSIFKAASGQTANLTEWQNSAGTVLSSIGSGGILNLGSGTYDNYNANSSLRLETRGTSGTERVYAEFQGVSANDVANENGGAFIRFRTSRAEGYGADIGAVRKPTGASEFRIKTGDTTANNIVTRLSINQSGNVLINGFISSTIGLIIKGAVSQTANLQEWQDSSGTVGFRVNASPQTIGFNAATTARIQVGSVDTMTYNASTGWAFTPYDSSKIGLTVKGATSQTADLQQWQNSAGTVLVKIAADGRTTFPGGYADIHSSGNLTVRGSDAWLANASALIGTGYAGGIGLIVKGSASQTANLQQWQDSAGNVLTRIQNNGSLSWGAGASVLQNTSGTLTVNPSSASVVPVTVKGAASQTADLQQWQDSSGNVLAKIASDGKLTVGYGAGGGFAFGSMSFAGVTYNGISNPAGVTSTPTLVIKGIASQTANLTEWQNSAGTTMAWIDAYGHVKTDGYVQVGLNNGFAVGGAFIIRTNYSSNNSINIGNGVSQQTAAQVQVTNSAAGIVGLIVKAAASQTANLQEWQNSGGTALAYITPAGNMTATSFVKSGGTSSEFLKANGSVDSSTYVSTSSSYISGHHPEGRILASAALVNDLANARLRGSTFTFTNISPADADIDKMFDGTANFLIISPTSSQTFPIVIEFTLPRTLSWGATVGVGFGLSTWRANSVKIEAFSNGAWVTCIDTTTNTSEDVIAGIPGLNSSGTTKLRYTFANPNSSQLRICHLWAYNYNSDMWTHLQMPRSGGTMYGALSTKGSISVLNSSNTATISLNQDGGGSVAKTDPFGGLSWNLYGNVLVRTAGTFGGYNGFVTIGSATQASSTPALVLRGHTEFDSLTNSSPLQVWQKADGTLLAKVDQFGAFTVNVNSASSIPLILKGASSQSANLQEWQDSAGSVLASISATGGFTIPSLTISGDLTVNGTTTNINTTNLVVEDKNIILGDVTSPSNTTADGGGITLKGATDKTLSWVQSTKSFTSSEPVIINNSSTDVPTLIVKLNTGQTSNIQEWQNSSGTVLAQILPGGGYLSTAPIRTTSVIAAGFNSTLGQLSSFTDSATRLGFGVMGSVGQTADLVQLSGQFPGALIVAGYNAIGQSYVGSASPILITTGGATTAASGTGTTATITTTSAHGLATGDLVTVAGVTPTGYNGTFLVTGTPSSTQFTYANTTTGAQTVAGTVSVPAQTSITARSAGTVPLIIRSGAASGSGSRWTVWQNSGGGVNAYVDNYGGFYCAGLGPVAQNGGYITTNSASPIQVSTSSTTIVPLLVKAIASQTANLQEWQDSSGTVLVKIAADGRTTFSGGRVDIHSGGNLTVRGSDAWSANTSALIGTSYAGGIGLIVKGSASQTANLQEWQDNSGTVLAKVDVNGAIKAAGLNIAGQEVSSNINLLSGYRYFVDTTAARTLTLPASPLLGDEIQIFDASNLAGTNNITVDSNNAKIEGVIEQYSIDVNGAAVTMIYTGSTFGWKVRI